MYVCTLLYETLLVVGVADFNYELSSRQFLKPSTKTTRGYDAQLAFIS
jgi:hypothetical protein